MAQRIVDKTGGHKLTGGPLTIPDEINFTTTGNPEIDSSVAAGTISLNWKGADTNTDDVLSYELFFGETIDPPLVSSDLTSETSDIAVESGKTYYWKVNTLDNFGAKTIGQVWNFSVN